MVRLTWVNSSRKSFDSSGRQGSVKDNFFLNFLDLARGTEIPELFALWSGIGAASAVLGRRVWLDMGPYTVFPNVYILLVAGSARHRKSSSLNLAMDLIYELPIKPNLLPQKTSPEKFLEDMKKGSNGTRVAGPCEGFVFASEFVTFLNQKNYQAGFGSILTDFWDCPKVFDYGTKTAGSTHLEYVCFGILGASTIEFLRDAIPEEAIGSGLTSRFIFVYSKTPPPPIARVTFDETKIRIRETLKKALDRLVVLNAPAQMDEGAWEVYDKEYMRWFEKSDFWENKTLEGYAGRRNVQWLKVALIFACCDVTACTEKGVIISAKHLLGSLKILEQAEEHMKIVTAELTTSDIGRQVSRVLAIIQGRGAVYKSDIVHMMMHSLSVKQLNEILDTLVMSGKVEVKATQKGLVYVFIKPES